ncbi:(Fe-S)-binding protein [Siminovitchia fortis]|uniref:Glycolate oxidase iron-sulfur subunit n=1 Tax=Siminovitchia fortis TaxID=254758 RepID=A0A443IZP5_9BACI|nr:(Fe-S)-binding protein [Siminovitchia fortis]RWR13634.1 (Fe-S)-binding protein [Siminovitchia fortis]WHY81905.1 (Fe-S)-binding protein [Siminovitchia fortis]
MSKSGYNQDHKYASLLHDLSYEAANMCVQCGYCLPACPTYESMGNEAQSPRGRINLVKMAAEGKIDLQQDLAEPIDLCLGCRACEVACPVNVPYGQIYEAAKEVITLQQKEEQKKRTAGMKIRDQVLNNVFPHQNRLRFLGNATWLYQKTGVNKLAHKLKIVNKVSEPMGQFEKILPLVESPSKRYKFGDVFPSSGSKKMTVAFFPGCIMDAMMSKVNRLTIELLQSVGCEVFIPKGQNCCGALHAHQGSMEEARKLAKANIEAFESSGADYFINNAGGCGAILREYGHLFKEDVEWRARAQAFVEKTRDITEVLVELGPLPFKKDWDGVITYQDSCHLRNVQGVYEQPRELLRSVPGATFSEMEGSDRCCASGGIYNLIHFEESMKILDDKMVKAKETRAQTIVTTNPGCLLQMKLGVERSGLEQTQALHIVEVLAEACDIQ